MAEKITEERMQEMLLSMFNRYYDFHVDYEELELNKTKTFEEAGLITLSKGIVITLDSDDEFQITIVRSK